MQTPSVLLAALLALLATSASAHVTLNPPTVTRNSYAVSAVRVPHGCDGASTTGITVKIPDGVSSVKPQAVPGWTVTITTRPLNPPITSEGKTINTTVDTVTWNNGPAIPDSQYADFGLQWKTPDAVTRIVFPVTQVCEGGKTTAWDQVPKTDEEKKNSPRPAPGVSVTDPPAATVPAANATAAAAAAAKSAGSASVSGGVAAVLGAAVAGAAALFA
ncbi:hypothetical protein H9P43_006437 [Blastocladiella emersonii ATCC 22665]|nr:hypothetical protein H9P43_006437 [Blastocladiella emersonii ATCC 22665]